MSDPERHIAAWQDAGLLDDETASRLRAFEARSRGAVATEGPPLADDRPGVIEVLLYLGFTVAGAGAFFLVAQQWDELESWGRVALIGVTALLALAAGTMHFSSQPGVSRAGHIAWLLAVPLVTATVGITLNEFGPGDIDRDAWAFVLIGLVAFVLAFALWAVAPSHPQVVGVTGATVFFGEALGAWPDDYNPRLAGLTMAIVGVVILALVERGIFRPRQISRFAGAGLLGAGAFHAGVDSSIAWEMLAFVAGAGLIALGVTRRSFTYVAVGVGTLLLALITFMFEHFGDRIGAPVALILSGGLLIAAVLILIQVRGIVRRRHVAPA